MLSTFTLELARVAHQERLEAARAAGPVRRGGVGRRRPGRHRRPDGQGPS